MQIHIIPGMRFRYVGPGDGRGTVHTVTSAAPDMVTTWGESFRVTGGGDTWAGPPASFIEQFRPIQDK